MDTYFRNFVIFQPCHRNYHLVPMRPCSVLGFDNLVYRGCKFCHGRKPTGTVRVCGRSPGPVPVHREASAENTDAAR